jgi:hypothetical protein
MPKELNMGDYLNTYISLEQYHSSSYNVFHLPEAEHSCSKESILHIAPLSDIFGGEQGEHLAIARKTGWHNPFSAGNILSGFYSAIEDLGYKKWYAYTWPDGRDSELEPKLQKYFDEDGIHPDTFQLSGESDGGYTYTYFVSDPHLPLGYHRLPYKFEECDPDKHHYAAININELSFSPQTRRRLLAYRIRYLRNSSGWWEEYSNGVLYSSIPEGTPKQVIFAAYLKIDPFIRLLKANTDECLETISSFDLLNKEDLRELRYAIKAQNADVSKWRYLTTYVGAPRELTRFDTKSGNYDSFDFKTWAISLKKPNCIETEPPAFTSHLATFSPNCLW